MVGLFGVGGRSLAGTEKDFQFTQRLQPPALAEFFAQGDERPPQDGLRPLPVKLVVRSDLVPLDLLELALGGFEIELENFRAAAALLSRFTPDLIGDEVAERVD